MRAATVHEHLIQAGCRGAHGQEAQSPALDGQCDRRAGAIRKEAGRALTLRGLDAIDGAPLLDIKPWMMEFAPIGETRRLQWTTELMGDYYQD